MRVQTKRQTIYQLYVQGGRHLPFMVIHHGLLHWHYDVIVRIHRKFKVGPIDRVTMYHTHRPTDDSPPGVLEHAAERVYNDFPTYGDPKNVPVYEVEHVPYQCKHWAEPLWYRIGKGWSIRTLEREQAEHDHTNLAAVEHRETPRERINTAGEAFRGAAEYNIDKEEEPSILDL